MTPTDIDFLKKELAKEKLARAKTEKILQDKSRNLLRISKDLKLANQKLTDLLEKKSIELQGLFDNINDAYLLIDMDLNVIKMNEITDLFTSTSKSNKLYLIIDNYTRSMVMMVHKVVVVVLMRKVM